MGNPISKLKNIFFKDLDEFVFSFDKGKKVSREIHEKLFELYKQAEWTQLEKLFYKYQLNENPPGSAIYWPPANGGYNIIDEVQLKKGMQFDRFQENFIGETNDIPNLYGSFTSPMPSGKSYSYSERALQAAENGNALYYEIEVLRDLPIKGQLADIIPWHGKIGGGKQMMWKIPIDPLTGYPKTWNTLAKEGYIKITIKKSPNGKHSKFENIIIQK